MTRDDSQTRDSIDRSPDSLDRRTFVRAAGITGGTLALGTGAASAHSYGDGDSSSTTSGSHDHSDTSQHADSEHTELLDYHSLGGIGASSNTGKPDDPHYGALTEIRTFGDYAYVGIFSSDDPTNDRGMAILDIHEFNDAETLEALRDAELTVLSFVRNDDPASAVMDAKVADDGQYVFMSKQPYTALFNETDPTPGTDNDSTSPSAGSVIAVDVSDPGNPEVTGSYNGWTTGSHNGYYYRIDGEEYIFACKDLNDGTAGLYVLLFDRTTGQFALVNRWTLDGDLSQGELGDSGLTYIHDITVQNDPRTGKPYGYLSYWGAGLRVLDLSDPTNIEEIGRFSMDRAHYAEPAPGLVDGKRVVVAGQETSSQSEGSTGTIHLLDADGLDDGYDGSQNLTELDVWQWQSNASFENFTLSPHNFDVTEEGWVHIGHYHGGVRYLRMDVLGESLREEGYYKPHEEVPEASKMEGLNTATPFTWGAVERNGITFASDINTGVYAVRHEFVPFGDEAGVDVSAARDDDGSAFTAGQTDRIDIAVAADRTVTVRDRIPAAWSIVGGGVHTETVGDSTYVTFDESVEGGQLTYFAEAPSGADNTGTYTFGPVEFSTDDGGTWTTLPGTTEENAVVGVDSSTLGLLGVVGTGGAAYRFREGIRRLTGSNVLGNDEDTE